MKRKLITFMTVVLAVLSLVSPASASIIGKKTDIVIDAECFIPDITIEVTVPSSSQAYLNPTRVPVEIDGVREDSQIISEPAYIENESVVPIAVSASVTGVPTGELTFRSSTTQGQTITAKKAFVYFEMQAAGSPNSASWDEEYDSTKHIYLNTVTRSKANIATLAAKDERNGPRYGVFRLTGDCVEFPKSPWTEEDGFTATIAFTFTAMPYS